jgi:hypothetical protein
MFYQGFNEDIGTKVVTVNGITYTAWDTLNVTNISYVCSKHYNLIIHQLVIGIHLKLLL